MSNELTDVRCPCGAEFQADSYDAGFIAGSGMCQNCDAAMPPKDIPAPVEQAGGDERVIGWRERILAAHPNSDPGFWPDALLVEHMAAEIADLRAALAQPSPAQAEQAEAERPEVVAWRYGFSGGIVSDKACLDEWKSGGEYQSLMTVAQHERIVGALRAKTDQLREALEWRKENQAGQRELLRSVTAERDAALAEVERLRESKGDPVGSLEKCMKVMYERDENAKRLEAALARVAELEKELAMARDAAAKGDAARHAAGGMEMEIHELKTKLAELEKQEPVAWGAFHFGGKRDGKLYTQCETEAQIEAYILDMHRSSDSLTLRKGPLYAAPVAQAQQLNDLDKQCRDDVARALGLRPNQERGFAWSYLLASIKSCVKASGDSAQAQHSVPEASEQEKEQGWTLDYRFVERVTELAASRTEYTTSMEATEQVLLAARELLAAAPVCRLSRSALTDAQMRRLYDSSTETENERLGFAAFARLIRRAEAVHQIAAAPGKEVGHE